MCFKTFGKLHAKICSAIGVRANVRRKINYIPNSIRKACFEQWTVKLRQ
jgi:hypothetical protein